MEQWKEIFHSSAGRQDGREARSPGETYRTARLCDPFRVPATISGNTQ